MTVLVGIGGAAVFGLVAAATRSIKPFTRLETYSRTRLRYLSVLLRDRR